MPMFSQFSLGGRDVENLKKAVVVSGGLVD